MENLNELKAHVVLYVDFHTIMKSARVVEKHNIMPPSPTYLKLTISFTSTSYTQINRTNL